MCAYVGIAWLQKAHLNLSATAGGQMPYLEYAARVAEEGLFGHLGDRNRMPLVPVLTSLVHDRGKSSGSAVSGQRWGIGFVNRAAWLSLVLSLAALFGMAAVAFRSLPTWPAVAFTLVVAFGVFLPQASFVQAELPYYGLFFCGWWMMCRTVQCPAPLMAAATGALLGLAYLTKASALPAIFLFAAVLLIRAFVLLVQRLRGAESSEDLMFEPSARVHAANGDAEPDTTSCPDVPSAPARRFAVAGRTALCAIVGVLAFLLVTGAYLRNNRVHFGRYFYNVNSAYFMWCDNWAEAQRFAETYDVERRPPQAPAEAIPGPRNYWNTHSLRQIVERLQYGLAAIGRDLLSSACAKYLGILAVCGLMLTATRPGISFRLVRNAVWPILLSTLLLGAYVLAYAWYAVVAFGDRFVLSLVPPALFAMLWAIVQLNRRGRDAPGSGESSAALDIKSATRSRSRLEPVLAGVLILLAAGDGLARAQTAANPTSAFVQFYYDESLAELRRGNVTEAALGFAGVVRLDPSFAAAHRELGMIHLHSGQFEDAAASLSRAAALEPSSADIRNSLGSALIQAGRVTEAIAPLREAVALDDGLAVAWFNLGGAYVLRGKLDEARACQAKLLGLAPDLAEQLEQLLRGSK